MATTGQRDVRALYHKHFKDRRKERQMLSSASFFVTFAAVRAITHAIRAERGPFRNITPGGRHIHHMTFGIMGLLTVGYLWLLEIGTDEQRHASRDHLAGVRERRGADARRVRAVAEPRGRLLDQAGTGEHRRGRAVRLAAQHERSR